LTGLSRRHLATSRTEAPMPKRSYPRVRYTGELATPIRMQEYKNVDAAIEIIDNRLTTLASVHNVDLEGPNAGWDLAIALAHAHVPGLRLPKLRKPRRQATWLAGRGELLRWEIDAARKNFNGRIAKAIAHLRADKTKLWSEWPLETLAARYREACRRYRSASQPERIKLALMAHDAKRLIYVP
jgi:hypothetical protein